jgi:hypothetical protein
MWRGTRPSRERNSGEAHRQGRSTRRTSLPVLDLTIASRRRQTASARASLPLFAAPDAWRSASFQAGALLTKLLISLHGMGHQVLQRVRQTRH